MDNDTIQILLAAIGGFSGGSLASAAGLAGYTPHPDETPRPRLPWCIRWCPPFAGLFLAVIIWMLVRDDAGGTGDVLTVTVVSFIVGIAAGAVSLNVQSMGAGARR